MFHFLLVATGGISTFIYDKTSVQCMALETEEEEETPSTPTFLEEDAIFSEITIMSFVFHFFETSMTGHFDQVATGIAQSLNAPPPEQV